MKKTNVNISMWDAVATIPMQKRLLQQELERIESSDQSSTMESATSLVQPAGDVETNKKVRPRPFYVSLIIGGKLVHNCMIDSGASSSVMPRCVADALGMKYEPIVRDVLLLDCSTVKTVGILRNVEMALHACPGCIVIQDISVVEVKPHFSICLSRDFTAQIGGFISSDWSYMSFKTRYGANASIRAEPQALHHTESYTPNPIQMNFPILEMNENDIVNEPATSLAEIPNFFLDEWASAYQFEPMPKTLETDLSTYCILEKDALVPNLVGTREDMNEIWSMYFDGSRNKNGSEAGVMLISPAQIRYYFSFRL